MSSSIKASSHTSTTTLLSPLCTTSDCCPASHALAEATRGLRNVRSIDLYLVRRVQNEALRPRLSTLSVLKLRRRPRATRLALNRSLQLLSRDSSSRECCARRITTCPSNVVVVPKPLTLCCVSINTAAATWQICANVTSSLPPSPRIAHVMPCRGHASTTPGAHDLRIAFISLRIVDGLGRPRGGERRRGQVCVCDGIAACLCGVGAVVGAHRQKDR